MNENKVYTTIEEVEKDFFPDFYIENQNSIIVENPNYRLTGLDVKCPYCGAKNKYRLDDIFLVCDSCHKQFRFKKTKLIKITSVTMEDKSYE
jgi:Zn finger protein HypA/HybF involved in hydrogenase expression